MLSLSFGVCDEWKAEAGAQEQRLQDGRRACQDLFGVECGSTHTDAVTLFSSRNSAISWILATRLCLNHGPSFQDVF